MLHVFTPSESLWIKLSPKWLNVKLKNKIRKQQQGKTFQHTTKEEITQEATAEKSQDMLLTKRALYSVRQRDLLSVSAADWAEGLLISAEMSAKAFPPRVNCVIFVRMFSLISWLQSTTALLTWSRNRRLPRTQGHSDFSSVLVRKTARQFVRADL